MTIAFLFGSLILYIALNIPIAISLGLSALTTLIFASNVSYGMIVQQAATSLNSFPIMAIPFFMLAGILMSKAGISKRLLNLANALVGSFTGGLAQATILASMFFSAISGSGPATVAAIGSFMIPTMKDNNYDKGFAASITATAGSIGVIIPPSIPFVVYGITGEVSIGAMFLAGIIPGIIIGLMLMIFSYIISKKNNYSAVYKRVGIKGLIKAINDAKWALMIPIVVLGGIYGGIFTPTEAAVIAVVYAIFVGLFVYREMSLKDLYDGFAESCLVAGTTMVIIALAISFSYLMTVEQVPRTIANFITNFSENKLVILLLINVFLIFVGAFIDTISAIIVLTPMLLPVVTQVGVDPVHFGVILVANLAIGFVTPPVGVNLFVASNIGLVSIERIVRSIIPLFIALIISLILITYIPFLSTFLPEFFL
ncbi:MAG: TRAP transporter large permease [Tindallia sp. MSAO_Bac2]|nr:MAG: TRAP transporter large permease [Tindallia sp. MSAO_Bac2]